MATKSIIGAEDDENEFLLFDRHRNKQRKKKNYYKRKCSDEDLSIIRRRNFEIAKKARWAKLKQNK